MEYIEREAAVNAVLNLVPKVDCDGYCWVIRGDAARAIDSIPAADVRPAVRGMWTDKRTIEHDGEWYCTACGKEITIYMGADREDRYAFCPNCGADMREES